MLDSGLHSFIRLFGYPQGALSRQGGTERVVLKRVKTRVEVLPSSSL